jgi:rod shape-determining protein MreD
MIFKKRYSLLYFVILSSIAILLQSYFIPLIEINTWRPNLIILVIIYFGFRFGVFYGTIGGFLLGIFQDSIGTNLLGISSLANCIVGFIAGQTKQVKLSINTRILTTIFLILLNGFIFYFFYQFNSEVKFLYLLFSRVFPNTIYTFIIGIIIYILMQTQLEGTH